MAQKKATQEIILFTYIELKSNGFSGILLKVKIKIEDYAGPKCKNGTPQGPH